LKVLCIPVYTIGGKALELKGHMPIRLTIKEVECRYPEIIKGQVWKNAAAKYWFRCLVPDSRHPDYQQAYYVHQQGKGCPVCGNIKRGNVKRLTIEEAERRCPDMVKGQVWKGNAVSYWFHCPLKKNEHPDYFQLYHNHRSHGQGCPLCGDVRGTVAHKAQILAKSALEAAEAIGKTYDGVKVLSLASPNKKGQTQVSCQYLCCGLVKDIKLTKVLNDPPAMCEAYGRKREKVEQRLRPFEAMYNWFKSSNLQANQRRKRRRSFTLTYEEFLEFTKQDHCHYCHSSVEWKMYNLNIGSSPRYNLDRMDNNVGYEAFNLVVCCWKCNDGKGNAFTHEEWFKMTECFRNKATLNLSSSPSTVQ